MKFYFINRPSMKNTTIPKFYYTFAENEDEAKLKIELKWGEIDEKTTVRELSENEIEKLVIATNNYG